MATVESNSPDPTRRDFLQVSAAVAGCSALAIAASAAIVALPKPAWLTLYEPGESMHNPLPVTAERLLRFPEQYENKWVQVKGNARQTGSREVHGTLFLIPTGAQMKAGGTIYQYDLYDAPGAKANKLGSFESPIEHPENREVEEVLHMKGAAAG